MLSQRSEPRDRPDQCMPFSLHNAALEPGDITLLVKKHNETGFLLLRYNCVQGAPRVQNRVGFA
jgi:hypothetical protein